MPVDITHDPEADAAYIRLSTARILESEEVAPDIILDYAEDGRVIGIEILSASQVLAPGDWQKARRPGKREPDAAE